MKSPHMTICYFIDGPADLTKMSVFEPERTLWCYSLERTSLFTSQNIQHKAIERHRYEFKWMLPDKRWVFIYKGSD